MKKLRLLVRLFLIAIAFPTSAIAAPPACLMQLDIFGGTTVNDTVYVCVGTDLQLEDASVLDGLLSDRDWDFGDGNMELDAVSSATTVHNYSEEGTYVISLTVESLLCPSATTTRTVIVLGQPQYDIVVQEIDCFGDCDGQLTLNLQSDNAGLYSVVWDIAGIDGNSVTGLCAGDYSAVVTDGLGCTSLTPGPINIPQPEELISGINLPDTVGLCPFSGTTLVDISFAGGDGNYQSTWDVTTAISQLSPSQMQFTPTEQSLNQMYGVVMTDGLGCTTSDSIFFQALPSLLGGTVSVGSNPCVNCKVFQYQHEIQPGVWDTLRSTVTDVNGDYEFGLIENFLPFAIMVNPDTLNHPMASPGFYPEGHLWSTATILENVCGSTLNKHVQLLEPLNFNGDNTLNGTVWYSANGKTQTGEDPIPLIDVVVEKTPPGQAQGRIVTNDDGEYEFDFVPNSDTTYTLYVSLPGVPVYTTYEVLADDGGEVFSNLDFCLNIDSTAINICGQETPVVTGEEPEISTDGFVVFPNPNNGRFAIETGKFAATQSEVRIVDTMGRLVYRKRYDETPFIINMVNIADGYYSVQILNKSDTQASPVSVIR